MAKKKSERATDAVLRLQTALKEAKNADYVRLVFKKATSREIAAAEKKLKVKLPPSYLELVTGLGAFKVVGPCKTSDWDNAQPFYNPVLLPSEMVTRTLRKRSTYADNGEEDVAEMLEDSLLFQGNVYYDNFFTFR